MMKKQFQYSGKTGIAPSNGFKKKRLADLVVNIGNACEFSCSYCYVPDMPFHQPSIKELLRQGHRREQFSNYRHTFNVIKTVKKDLEKISPDDTSVVLFCTTCDPCSNAVHTQTTIQASKLILEKSNLQIRILSKSDNILDVAKALADYKDRVSYGLSTGTCLDEISRSIEVSASPIKDRVAALHWLQDHGYHTFGMICPVLPSEVGRVRELLGQIRPEFCDNIWVEAINDKGRSLTNTLAALTSSGLDWHSYALRNVIKGKDSWRKYTQDLYRAFSHELGRKNSVKKLHFLQYTTKADRDYWSVASHAVCL